MANIDYHLSSKQQKIREDPKLEIHFWTLLKVVSLPSLKDKFITAMEESGLARDWRAFHQVGIDNSKI